MIGEVGCDAAKLAISEGYAAASSVHEALGIPVAMAIDAGNLLAAGRGLRRRFPDIPILIAADNDVGLTLRDPPLANVGLEKATEAARGDRRIGSTG